ncbi:MAG: type IV secretion system protein [Steroidobacteraceae bacterium]
MGFFETFWSWLDGELVTYIGDNTARLASALEPAIVALATIYVMLWGYLQLSGQLQEPVTAGLRRIVVLVVVLGGALHLWLYDAVIVDTFYRAPAAVSAAVVGSADPVATVDAIWASGGQVADELWNRGGVLSGDFGFYLAGVVVWLLMGLLCVYTMFLIALSSIASAILLALGPLFIVMLLFDATRRYFEGWLAQLATYAFINILTVLVGALLLQLVSSYAAQTAARGAAIATVDALDMVLAAMIVFLLLRQIMPIAGGLAGGIAPSTFGAVSRAVGWGMGRGRAFAGRGMALAADVAVGAASTERAARPRALGEGGT